MPRAVFPGIAHHLTQRGVDRQQVFFADRDRRVYLQLVQGAAMHFGVSLAGYCLMPNHVHWIAVPNRPPLWPRPLRARMDATPSIRIRSCSAVGIFGKTAFIPAP